MRKRFLDFLSRFGKKTVLVIGDLMLDEWIWGSVSRISPEAPVPVVQVEKRTFTPGGASNVAANLRSLGARALVGGVVGKDDPGKILRRKLRECNADLRGLLHLKGRPTTLKTRIIAHSQQVVRADFEAKEKLNGEASKKMDRVLIPLVVESDAVLFSDYNKGCMASAPIKKIIQEGNRAKKILVAGPKPVNLHLFKGVTLLVLNQGEAEQFAGFALDDEQSLKKTGFALLNRMNARAVFVTRGENGMSIFESGKEMISIPARASQVYDVSGAGDTVIAVATLALAAGASFHEAALLSNHAAGVVVRKVGTATVSRKELEETF